MLYRIELYDVQAETETGPAPAQPAAVFVAVHTRRFDVLGAVRTEAARAAGSLSKLAGALLALRDAEGASAFVLAASTAARRTVRVSAIPGALRVSDPVEV